MNRKTILPNILWKKFIERGAIASSSTWLSRRMVSSIPDQKNLTVVELGAGTGSFTRQIIKKLGPAGKLVIVEINHHLAQNLSKKYHDPRISVISGDASTLTMHLRNIGVSKVDYIISGLPLGNFSVKKQDLLYFEMKNVLRAGGTYIQFQYFMASFVRIRKWFETISIEFEPRNIPPAFVMTFRKENRQ